MHFARGCWRLGVLISCATTATLHATPTRVDVAHLFNVADTRLRNRVAEVSAYPELRWPIARDASSATWTAKAQLEWDSGYFPGMLWKMYRRNGDAEYLHWAKKWTHGLVGVGPNDPIPQAAWSTMSLQPAGHDVGLVYLNAFAEGHAATQSFDYARVVIHAAKQTAARFDPARGTIRSWDWGSWNYPVIIDGMMSVQALNWSVMHGGPAEHWAIAATHTTHNARYHVRADGSTYHVVDFGQPTPVGSTFQGYNHESTWSRGQAWAIHGFAMSLHANNDPVVLDAARRAADFWIDNTTSDPVPLWDMELPDNGPPTLYRYDASAAAIAASGLIDLATITSRPDEQRRYFQQAERILHRLASVDFLESDTPGENRLILHSVGNFNGGNALDADLIYADYYFIEALERYELAFPGPGIGIGDATRDGHVNFDDLLVLAQHYGLTSGQNWLSGDFTNDGAVNFDDLLGLAQRYATTSSFAEDWALAQAMTPEPTNLLIGMLAASVTRRRRRFADSE